MQSTRLPLRRQFSLSPVRIWERVINVGVHETISPWDYKRVRLLNGIVAISLITYLGYVVALITSADYVTFYLCAAYALLSLPTFALTYYRRYNAAAYYWILLNTVLYTITPILKKNDGSEYILIANSLVAMLFFRGVRPIVGFFLLNVAALYFVRYAVNVFPPILYNASSLNVYYANVFLSLLIMFLIVYYFRSENERQERLLTQQNAQLQQSLNHLTATQNQLIQAEKMASLGELTAGIAHEIQNPLNFVNNFAEVSVELLRELADGPLHQLPPAQREEADDLVADLTQNLRRISHHGGRADSIVKGMLQHSRASTGEKRPTNLNALADEYLKLAYHGLRAKDKEFNAELVTQFDPTLGPIEMVPQDVGRVLLNLYTNAFYAIAERKRNQPTGYQPMIRVSTHLAGPAVEIRVGDNGMGIPSAVKAKIFQPFFTTKPTGEGTGLGLSLSYDMVTKGHGGTLTVETREGEGTEFVVRLPVKQTSRVPA